MEKLLIFCAIVVSIAACKPSNAKNTEANTAVDVPASSGPDDADLLRTLQGRWQSDQDSTYVVEFDDTRMLYYQSGNLTAESEIEVDGQCQNSPCKADSTDLTDGWCFQEKGKFDVQCNIVMECDKTHLKYGKLGADTPPASFKKVRP